MEIVYSIKPNQLINSKITAVFGDKIDLINNGFEIKGINYNDEWTVRRFLNGYKFKISQSILKIFSDLEISYSILNKHINELSRCELKLVLFVYAILYIKGIIILDYYDKGLPNKVKNRIINYLKINQINNLVVISNDLVFLNNIANHLIVFKNGKIVFNDEFDKLYKSKIKLDYPTIIKFIKLANKSGAKLNYTVNNYELIKDIYRSVK